METFRLSRALTTTPAPGASGDGSGPRARSPGRQSRPKKVGILRKWVSNPIVTPLTAAYSPGWGPSVGSKNICRVSEAPRLGEQESTLLSHSWEGQRKRRKG